MNIVAKLTEARALIADPEHWCQGESAIENTGAATDPWSKDAYAFCADGAVARATGVRSWNSLPVVSYCRCANLLDRAANRLHGGDKISRVDLNDGEIEIPNLTPHQAVLKMFDLAIERAIAEAGK